MSGLLNTASTLMCPHGGTVNPISSNTRVNASGAPVLRRSDTFIVAGCGFSPGGAFHPCISVQWLTSDLRSRVLANLTLSDASVGLCLAGDMTPQGTVIIAATQQSVSGQ
jgi:hypothetical protein